VLRRLLLIAALALVVGLGIAPSTRAAADDDRDSSQQCVSSVECAGATVLVGLGLAVIVPTVLSGAPGIVPVTRLVSRPRTLHPRLMAGRLYRPPRPS
jgi:hypothetical protein